MAGPIVILKLFSVFFEKTTCEDDWIMQPAEQGALLANSGTSEADANGGKEVIDEVSALLEESIARVSHLSIIFPAN